MEAQVDTLCLLEQPKDNNKLKNKKQLELTENRTVRKSDNQGDKEETFNQTSGRGREGQPGGEDSEPGGSWQTWQGCVWIADQVVPHQLADKLREQLGNETD